MKIRILPTLVALLTLLSGVIQAAPLGTAFTYQGHLTDSGNPANGSYDLRLILYTAEIGGSQVGPTRTNENISVTSGLFTTPIDFGVGVFDGTAYWLEMAVRAGSSMGSFTLLDPRQPLMPVPYSLYAPQAGHAITATVAAAMPWRGLTDVPLGFVDGVDDDTRYFAGTGLQLSGVLFSIANGGVTAAQLADGAVTASKIANGAVSSASINDGSIVAADVNASSFSNTFWKLNGNGGTAPGTHFLGTSDNQALEFKVNNARALRLQPARSNSVNVIAGYAGNFAPTGAIAVTIAGGGASNYLDIAFSNSVAADFGTLSGGGRNSIQTDALAATIGGGWFHTIQTNAIFGTIGGGRFNNIQAGAIYAVIGGGDNHTIGANAHYAAIGGGSQNRIQTNGLSATIAGGEHNVIETNAARAAIGGGFNNAVKLAADESVIAGGTGNTIYSNAFRSTIGGGQFNTIAANANRATIPGGSDNVVAGEYGFAAGRRAKANHNGAFVWADSQNADFASTGANQFCIRASGGVRFNGDTSLFLGSSTRQMINLWSTTWGIGVQDGTQYYRSGTRFSWFLNGTHSNNQNDPGPGGSVLMTLTSGGLTVNGVFVSASDRTRKERFEPVDGRAVLQKVAALPISTWAFKNASGQRHMGPMAQDFHAAFGLGADDKHIATVDADGVALAAIQGLNLKLEEQRAENAQLKRTIEELKETMKLLAQKLERGAR